MKNMTLKSLSAALFLVGGASVYAPATQAADALLICESGQPFLWPNDGQNIPFNPDQGNLLDPDILAAGDPGIDNAAGTELVQRSFDNWTEDGPFQVPTTATYANAGPLSVDVDGTNYGSFVNPVAPDGQSAIVFDADGAIFADLFGPGSGILGFAGPEWINGTTCEILEGRAFLNGPAFDNLTAAEDVTTHEFGHYSNLGHVELNGQLVAFGEGGDNTGPTPLDPFGPPALVGEIETMYPIYFGPIVGTLSPHADDVASLATLYPSDDFAATTGAISGTVYAADGETPLSGVNVIARNVDNPYLDAVSTFSGAYTDAVSASDPNVGTFSLRNLTPGAEYALFIDVVTAQAGRFSNPILAPLPGPEEFWNEGESNSDNPAEFDLITAAAGTDVDGTDFVLNEPQPGDPLQVGEDGFVELSMGFPFEFCGESYESVFIHANGFLTFGSPDTNFLNFVPSVPVLLGNQPRIAPIWDDLSPFNLFTGVQQGLVTFDRRKNSFSVIFDDVPEFPDVGSNSFEVTLKRSSDHIDIDYDGLSTADGLVGISCGGAVTTGSELPEDLNAKNGRINLKRSTARYENFDGVENIFDLADDRLRFNGTTDFNDNWAGRNDTQDKARRISLPFSSAPLNRFTEIDPEDDLDWFRFTTTGAPVLIAEITSSILDTVLVLADGDGNVLAFDDDGGTGVLSAINVQGLPAGEYFLLVATFDSASTGRYVLEIEESNAIPLALGDDDFAEVSLGFDFPFNGATYDSVFVNSNGNLTFGAGDTDFSESVGEFLSGAPRIAPLWDDLSPNQAGSVSVEPGDGELVVIFDGVVEFLASAGNTFLVTLRADGSYTIEYGEIAAPDGLAGATEGGGAADPGETDLGDVGSFPASGTTYESFSDFDNDLSGTVLEFTP